MASKSTTIPAPVGGWNARDLLDDMKPTDAIRMVNLFPEQGRVSLRKGYSLHQSGLGGVVKTIAEFSAADGTRQLIAAANGKLFNSSTSGGSPTQIGTGFLEDRWQWVNFRGSGNNRLLLFNGVDQPQQWDGTTLSAANYTGIANDDTIVQASVFKSRLYLLPVNSTSVWYGAPNAITGALTEFDVGSLLRKGGYLLFAGSWTYDTGLGLDDLFIMVSSMGEVLVYGGNSAVDWTITGRFYLPAPIGRRGIVNLASDLVIISQDGLIPMSEVIRSQTGQDYRKISDKIRNAFRTAGVSYSGFKGWEAIIYPRGTRLIVNIPTAENATAAQYVMNTETGAWCQFSGMNAVTWGMYNEKPYFGDSLGNIFLADTGYNDNGAKISFDLKGAFNYLKSRSNIKQFHMARPLLEASSSVRCVFNIDVDFADAVINDTLTTVGAAGDEWETAEWNSAEWALDTTFQSDWYAISGLGRCAAIRMKGELKDVSFSISAFNIIYDIGGFL